MRALPDPVVAAAGHMRARIGRGLSAQGFYAPRLRYPDLSFDIGASTGTHTAAMLKRRARVVAVEPKAELARELERNLPAATVVALAASDHRGQATLITSRNHNLATLNAAFPQGFRDTIGRM